MHACMHRQQDTRTHLRVSLLDSALSPPNSPVHRDVHATLLLDLWQDELFGLQHGHALGEDGLQQKLAGLWVVHVQLVHLHPVLSWSQRSPHLDVQLQGK